MPLFYDGTFWLFVGPALLLALWAEFRVSATFARYSRVAPRSGLSGAEAARHVLHASGLAVPVEPVPGSLTDHYDPRSRRLRLSEKVYAGRSLAALGVAAHEAGHALQHATGYAPMALRSAFVPVAALGSRAAPILFIIGLAMNGFAVIPGTAGTALMTVGIIALAAAVALQVVTLPVEVNASRRAMALLTSQGIVTPDEAVHARKVLTAAALTYVAAALVGIMQLLYYVSLVRGRR